MCSLEKWRKKTKFCVKMSVLVCENKKKYSKETIEPKKLHENTPSYVYFRFSLFNYHFIHLPAHVSFETNN